MTKHGKRYTEAYQQIDRTITYSPEEAVDLAKKSATVKFDETVELHLRMGLDMFDTGLSPPPVFITRYIQPENWLTQRQLS